MAHWRTEMRQAGFSPDAVVDAPERLGHIEATVSLADMKDARTGNVKECAGANCLRRKLAEVLPGKKKGDILVLVYASRAYVAWRNESGKEYGYRFLVNGLPDAFDRTMNVVGEKLILRPPNGKTKTGKRQGSIKKKHTPSGVQDGTRSHVVRGLAAQLRAM